MEKTKTTTIHKQKITLNIRILIWNATIRATLAYGLQTKNLTEEQYSKLERFAYNCHRDMVEPDWILQLKNNQRITQKHINQKNSST